MARRRPVEEKAPSEDFLLQQAAARLGPKVDLNGAVRLKYGADVDMLTIRFKERPLPTHSDSDEEAGIIYNYEGEQLVSIELLDISQPLESPVA